MKKNMKIFLAAVAAVVLLVSLFAGCSGSSGADRQKQEDKNTPINLTVILGSTKFAPDPELSLMNEYLDRLAAYGGHLCVIIDDGNPKMNFKELDLKSPDYSKTANYQKKEVNNNAKQAAEMIMSMKAITEETNTLAALKLAADNTPTTEQHKNVLIVFDNGIQTKKGNGSAFSAFTMTDLRVLDEKLDAVLQSLEKSKSFPDLSKFTEIAWYGIGQTVGDDQKPPPNCDVEALKDYYTKILEKGGVADAKSAFIDHTYKPSVSDHSQMPNVTPVKVTTFDEIQELDPEPSSETDKIIGDEGILHIDEAIQFKPNSTDELVNPESAKQVLAGLIERMRKLKGNIVIIGTTATLGESESAITFSEKRAMTIKKLIVSEEGIDDKRIFVFGAGFTDSDLVRDDLDANGKLDERIAPYNRAVNIMDESNSIAQRYLNGNGTTT